MLSGHNSGHSVEKVRLQVMSGDWLETRARIRFEWWAVQDSNLRPRACKADMRGLYGC